MNSEEYNKNTTKGLSKLYKRYQMNENIATLGWSLKLIPIYGYNSKSPTRIIDYIKASYSYVSKEDNLMDSLFKGVNKQLFMPIVIIRLDDIRDRSTQESFEESNHSVCFIQDDNEYTSFSPKNLVKYYGYTLIEAKKMHKNMVFLLDKYRDCSIKLLKKTIVPKYFYIALCGFKGESRRNCTWRLPSERCDMVIDPNDGSVIKCKKELYPDLLNDSDFPIPITDLSFWENIAREWYEKNIKSELPWGELLIEEQYRHVVNSIRHNMIDYEIVWQNVDDITKIHDKVFKRSMDKIAGTFPSLYNECQNQKVRRNL